ncbi:MAG: MBL fold metallo-hydrolase [Chitinivibrionales bacterium]|nr:MBL fold metallo-hydrolase [Chitinivibrionales bacterium]
MFLEKSKTTALPIHICVLASTSSGNSTLIWNTATAILIDFGLPVRYMKQHITQLGLSFKQIQAALLTHNHADHLNPVMFRQLLRENIAIFMHKEVQPHVYQRHRRMIDAFTNIGSTAIKTFSSIPFSLNPFTIQPFAVPHDSPGGCFGYCLLFCRENRSLKISITTDIGYSDDAVVAQCVDSDVIIVEANHDTELLENSNRPQWLKTRIKEIGHFSNEQCAEFLKTVIDRSSHLPTTVIVAHISQQCNTNGRALAALSRVLPAEISLVETFREKPSQIVTL